MKLNQDIVEMAIETACNHISQHLDKRFAYHDLSHTVFVVQGVEELATKMSLSRHDKMLLTVAAWFHDTGYAKQIDDHEIYGAQLAEEFLREFNIDAGEISLINACILSTKYPQQPRSFLQQIICDADMLHLVSKEFMASSIKLREEWLLTKQLQFTDSEWLLLNINFLANHRFHTSYVKKHLAGKKEKNIEMLKKNLKRIDKQLKQRNEIIF